MWWVICYLTVGNLQLQYLILIIFQMPSFTHVYIVMMCSIMHTSYLGSMKKNLVIGQFVWWFMAHKVPLNLLKCFQSVLISIYQWFRFLIVDRSAEYSNLFSVLMHCHYVCVKRKNFACVHMCLENKWASKVFSRNWVCIKVFYRSTHSANTLSIL